MNQEPLVFMLQKQLIFLSTSGGQFAMAERGHITMASGGQFKPVAGGQFEWIFQIDKIDRNKKATNLKAGNFYVFPELGCISEFAEMVIAVKLSDLDVKGTVKLKEIDADLDKEKWELFWQAFNLVQSSVTVIQPTDEGAETSTPQSSENTKYDCLKYHDASVHHIVKLLIENNIPFNKDGGFYFEYEGQYAESMLGFENKMIFISPLSDDDRSLFLKAGYKEVQPDDFNLNEIL